MKKKVKSKRVAKVKNFCSGGSSTCAGGGYFLGFLGATIYYITTASSFLAGFVGVLKALVWPAFLIFELMKFLGM
jgi:hypothetical protein